MNISTTPLQKNNLAEKIVGEFSIPLVGLMSEQLCQVQPGDLYPVAPRTDEEKRARIELAMQDYYNGNSVSHEALLKDIATW